jgi:serine protease
MERAHVCFRNVCVKYANNFVWSVAGTIGATARNNDGISGVLNNQDFCFLIGRVFGETDEGTRMSAVLQAIEWMVSKGVNVINMSLGSPDYTRAGEEVAKYAFTKGAILVASSGNSGTGALQYPASYPNVLSVAAVNANRTRASFSQYNALVDLSAPGVGTSTKQALHSIFSKYSHH